MGPLPQLHKFAAVSAVVAVCLGIGVWLAGYLSLPLGGIGVGLAAGTVLAFLFTRDFRRDRTHRHPTR